MIRTGRAALPSTSPKLPRPRDEARPAQWAPAVAVTLEPHLSFAGGQAGEALELYRTVLGGRVVDGRLETPGGLTLTGADAAPDAVRGSGGVAVSLCGGPEDAERLRTWFAGLSAGGEVTQPLQVTAAGEEVGAFVDRFGITWRVQVAGPSGS